MKEDIMADIEELLRDINSVDDAINMALTIENQGHNFYSEHALTLAGIAARDLFIYLAAEEAKHIEYLNQFKKTGNSNVFSEVHPSDFTASFAMEFSGDKPGEMDVLMGALSFEQKNENFYKEMAARTDDPDQKEFFTTMKSFEHQHLELIDSFIEEATQFRMQT